MPYNKVPLIKQQQHGIQMQKQMFNVRKKLDKKG